MKNAVSIIVLVVLTVFVIASFAHQVEWIAMGFLLLSVLFSLISYQLLIKHRDDFLSVNLGTFYMKSVGIVALILSGIFFILTVVLFLFPHDMSSF